MCVTPPDCIGGTLNTCDTTIVVYHCDMGAWNGWYHITTNTYGTWLPGDARGWRTRRHKQHVEGDYRNPPPPGYGTGLLRHVRENMAQGAVRLAPDQYRKVGAAVLAMLIHQKIEALAISTDAVHCHLLARFPNDKVRPPVGRAKKHAAFVMRESGLSGKLWERKSGVVPVKDRRHQVSVFRYILRHRDMGAWTWDYRQTPPPPLRTQD